MSEEVYSKEFDKMVKEYNNWFSHQEDSPNQKRELFDAFIQGLMFKSPTINKSKKNPLYFRNDLTANQKDAVALASDWQNVYESLDNNNNNISLIKNISLKDRIKGKEIAQQMYDRYKNIYIAIKE